MVKPNFKQQLQNRSEGVPQLSPFDAPAPSQPTPVTAPQPPPAVAPAAAEPAAAEPAVSTPTMQRQINEPETGPEQRQLLTRTVDTTQRPMQRGFHMYPQRHRQLMELAFIEERRPFQIIDDALQDYVRKHYLKGRGQKD